MKKLLSNSSLLPIILVLGYVPLLVHQFTYSTHLSQFEWFPNSSEIQTDFFYGYKAIATAILGISMLLILLWSYRKKNALSFEPIFFFLIAYAVLVLLSALFSPYRAYAFRLGFEVFQPVWIVLCYTIFCYYAYNCVQAKEDIFYIFRFSGLGIFLVTLIGVLQCININFWSTKLGQLLVLSPANWGHPERFDFGYGEVFSSLANPDYISFYFAMLIPIGIVFFLIADSAVKKILYGAMVLLFMICLFGSKALSGLLALVLTAIVTFFILISRSRRALITGGLLTITGCLGLIILVLFTPAKNKLSSMIDSVNDYRELYQVNSIETKEDRLDITIGGNELSILLSTDDSNNVLVLPMDSNGAYLDYTIDFSYNNSLTYTLNDPKYQNCRIAPIQFSDTISGVHVNIGTLSFNFGILPDGIYYYNYARKFIKFQTPQTVHLFPDTFLGRGWLWNRILPLLPKYILLGAGANNFILAYPQTDYLLRLQIFNDYFFDSKAHCWYLNEWVENGFPAMLCLIGFYTLHLIQSVRLYRRADLKSSDSLLGFGLFLGTLAYMFVALTNDSSITTAPPFWILLGLSLASNRIIKQSMPGD